MFSANSASFPFSNLGISTFFSMFFLESEIPFFSTCIPFKDSCTSAAIVFFNSLSLDISALIAKYSFSKVAALIDFSDSSATSSATSSLAGSSSFVSSEVSSALDSASGAASSDG